MFGGVRRPAIRSGIPGSAPSRISEASDACEGSLTRGSAVGSRRDTVPMPRIRMSMRWWLGLTFAAIAAVTAFSVAEVFNHRAATALRSHAEELAIGQSVSATRAVAKALDRGILSDAAPLIAERRRLSLYVFSTSGTLVTPDVSRSVAFAGVPDGRRATRAALQGDRYVRTVDGGQSFVIALELPGKDGAVVTYAQRPELLGELGIVQHQIVNAALIASPSARSSACSSRCSLRHGCGGSGALPRGSRPAPSTSRSSSVRGRGRRARPDDRPDAPAPP